MNEKDKEIAAARAEGLDAGKIEGKKEGVVEGTTAGIEEGKKAGFEDGKKAGAAEGVKQGAETERARVSAILTHKEAEGRSGMAQHLAFKTTSSVEDAVALLAAAPKDAAKPTDRLSAAMEDVKNPNVGADASADGEDETKAAVARIAGFARKPLKAVK